MEKTVKQKLINYVMKYMLQGRVWNAERAQKKVQSVLTGEISMLQREGKHNFPSQREGNKIAPHLKVPSCPDLRISLKIYTGPV